jgi:hypothetical protein
MYKVVGEERSSGGDIQQPATVSAAANQNPPSKSLLASFRESFICSGKQGGGATVLWEGCNIVKRETCVPTSQNVNNLGEATKLHFSFSLSSVAGGAVPNSACCLLGTTMLM